LLFNKGQYTGLIDDFDTDTPATYQIFFAGAQAGAIQFEGLITDFPMSIPLDDKVSISVTIKVTGGITIPDNGPYLIEYDANGADSGVVPDSQTKEHGVAIVLQDNDGLLALASSTFVGWNTAADGSGISYTESESFAADAYTVLYAEWV
ncbi:MAG: InlB B-repeat-containing protein, partial [Acholeplasmataceae bacterium]